ncbi:MAG: M1 family metallopeptidase [Ilumatobacter sp.]|jgi:puromycin-sensitive aminopeptidase|uniref:M1 family metallopeptidase n=1 Tax=Ilumatobacter sp. TaxID=1967498 RepID=UPI00391AE3A5
MASTDPYRLPTEVTPNRYDVRLRPSLDDATFDGNVSILLDVDVPVDTLMLNAAELTIESCLVDGQPATWQLDDENERLVVECPTTITGPSAQLEISFEGILNDKLRGFYRSTYVDDDGITQVIAASQMQSTDCRRAFPCWDEPEFKAVFGITLDVADGLTAISNGPEIDRVTADGRTVIRFADTMKMSCYLVALVVGRLEATEPIDVDGTPLRVVHVPGKQHLTAFGLDVGAYCLRWFEDYYGISYPSDKIDLVALPDFAAGAMENLGCITFRESLLLLDPATSTQADQQNVADVIAHELAHMWFGDLVTMRWWNGIWLNEAFATFMEVAACDAYRPSWERWTNFGLERTFAFEVDSLASTRPVEYEVRSPADCEGMFDVLTYQKGGALLRMLEQYLTPEVFRAGVGRYLRTHAYGNTETNDLWDAIEDTSGEPVRRIMDSWIWQPGYPQLSATLTKGGDGSTRLSLTQSRFSFPDPARADQGSDATVWVVPVHVRNGGVTQTLLLDSAGPLHVALDDPEGPVVVNAGGHGFSRVAYDTTLRDRLGDALADLDTLERYNLVDDAWAAAVSGQLSAVEMLEFIKTFEGERDLAVWQAITTALRGLSRLVDGDALAAFREQVRTLIRPAVDDLGEPTSGESPLVSQLRGLLVSTMGVLGNDPDTIDRCRVVLATAAHADQPTDPELLAAATSVVAATGGVEDYERMLDVFRHGDTPQEQLRNLYALTSFDDAELIRRTCEFAMGDAVRTQNAPFVLRLAIANRHHGGLAWEYVRDHWETAVERFPSNTVVRMIDSVKLLTQPEQVDDVQQFFTAHPIKQALKTQEQVLERQRVNAAFHVRNAADFAAHVG